MPRDSPGAGVKGASMKRKKWFAAAAAVCAALCAAGAVFLSGGYRADGEALAALRPGEGVEVYELGAEHTVFAPEEPEAGFIFYPGGLVEHTAYAPLLRGLAEEGILCVLAEMPLDLAVLGMNAADGVPGQFEEIDRWYIGGHSLGGAMAASHAASGAGVYDGLVLLAAYSTEDLGDSGMEVISLYGSEDGVLNMEKYEQSRSNLPQDAVELVLEGGCHAWFGSYGPQKGDGTPTLTVEEQTALTVEAVADMILN